MDALGRKGKRRKEEHGELWRRGGITGCEKRDFFASSPKVCFFVSVSSISCTFSSLFFFNFFLDGLQSICQVLDGIKFGEMTHLLDCIDGRLVEQGGFNSRAD